MGRYFAIRIGRAALTIVLVVTFAFVVLRLSGDPALMILGPEAPPEVLAAFRKAWGLDDPIWFQYLDYFGAIAKGELGRSMRDGRPAIELVLERIPATLALTLPAFFFKIALGIPAGIYAALHRGSGIDRAVMMTAVAGFTVPSFVLALILVLVFAVQLGWLPSGGRGATGELLGVHWSFLTRDGLIHLILPALNLSLFKVSLVLRLTRAGVLEVMPLDYVKFARAKGLTEFRVIGVHVLKNIMIPVVTVIGLEFGSVIAFSVVTESIFSWPGTGKLIIDSINVLDRPIIVAYLMMIVVVFVSINLIVDLVYTALDPRVRLEAQEA